MHHPLTVFDFKTTGMADQWVVVDDGVMGGRSAGQFFINEAGNGVFKGRISLDNFGGFSSVHYQPDPLKVQAYRVISIRLKGDGKRYQLRLKSSVQEYQTYVKYFETSGDWETVEIPLLECYPTFRGRRLQMPNYPGQMLSEIGFLIANKTEEAFRLEIDKINLH